MGDFVGTMNRLSGKVEEGRFVSPAGSIPWPGAAGRRRRVFRPEAVRLVVSAEAQLTATVTGVFFLGDRTRLFLDGGMERPLVVESVERRAFVRGEVLHLAVSRRHSSLWRKHRDRESDPGAGIVIQILEEAS